MSLTLELTRISAPSPIPTAPYDGWRCKHKNEPGAPDNPESGLPEVRPSDWQDGIGFGYELQWLSYDLMRRFNNIISPKRWRAVYDERIAFTNNQSWNDDTGEKRADFVNRRDNGAELPKLMKVTICGGSFYHGDAIGDRLWMYPGIHGIDANSIPSLDEVINNRWYFYAVDWFRGDKIGHFTQGWDGADYFGPVVIPLVLSVPVSYPLSWFERWVDNVPPNPLRYGG